MAKKSKRIVMPPINQGTEHTTLAKVKDDELYQERLRNAAEVTGRPLNVVRVLRHDRGATHVVSLAPDDESLAVLAFYEIAGQFQGMSLISQAHPKYVSKKVPEFIIWFPIDDDDERAYRKLLRDVRKELEQ